MNLSKKRVIALWKKGCSIQRIARWVENADNPSNACKPLGDLNRDFGEVESIIYNYQKEVGMI